MKWIVLGLTLALAVPRAANGATLPSAQIEFRIRLHAGADVAFPLFDPIREALWAPRWAPHLISGESVEPGLIFSTGDDGARTIWILDQYDPQARFIRYVTVDANELHEVNIRVIPLDASNCSATVQLRRTALVLSSAQKVRAFGHHAGAQGPHWEAAINAYLDRAKR
jgi:hypothetical protein